MPSADYPPLASSQELRVEAYRCWLRWQQVKQEAAQLSQDTARNLAAWHRERAKTRELRERRAALYGSVSTPAPAPAETGPLDAALPVASVEAVLLDAAPLAAAVPVEPILATEISTFQPREITAILAATAATAAATTAAAEMVVAFLAVAADDLEMAPSFTAAARAAARSIALGSEDGDSVLLLAKARAALRLAAGEPAPTAAV